VRIDGLVSKSTEGAYMRGSDKVIITCAVTGSIHTPSMSPHLPVTPAEIAEQSIAAAEAGAAIIHLHARRPENGQPSQDPGLFQQILPRIKQSTDAIVNVTTGGGVGMSMEDRLAPAHWAKPELTSLNMGSMNFGAFALADKYTWKHDWERPYLESTYRNIYSNTFEQIELIMTSVGRKYGTRFEFECYDVGHLYTLSYFAERGLIDPPFFIQCVLGVMGGIGADIDNLVHMRKIADRLFGDKYLLSVLAVGRQQFALVTDSATMGGHVRVGLEDNLYLEKGKLAESNADAVAKIKRVLDALSMTTATPDEARHMLALKGGNEVAF
jgi:uncharacterized protein (DUF849 family)